MERKGQSSKTPAATVDIDLDGELVEALEETIPRYFRAIRQAVEFAEGPDRLTMQQFRALQALNRGGLLELTTGLARHFRVAVPTMTKMLDGLVDRGLVERNPDPGSRRQILVRLTGEGRELLRRYDGIVESRLRQLICGLDIEQKQRLMLALGDIATVLDADTIVLPDRELNS